MGMFVGEGNVLETATKNFIFTQVTNAKIVEKTFILFVEHRNILAPPCLKKPITVLTFLSQNTETLSKSLFVTKTTVKFLTI